MDIEYPIDKQSCMVGRIFFIVLSLNVREENENVQQDMKHDCEHGIMHACTV